MQKINIRKIYYHLTHRYLTMSNAVIAVAFFIAASWAWGSVGEMQRNYSLQKEIDYKNRQAKLVELETATLEYQQAYYKTAEYQSLAVRERLGLADPGENVLILPANSAEAKAADAQKVTTTVATVEPSNLTQWLDFLFGGNQSRLQ